MRRRDASPRRSPSGETQPGRPGRTSTSTRYRAEGGYELLARLPRRRAPGRGRSSTALEDVGPARARRRGLPDRRASGSSVRAEAGAAADGGQRRRGRARHLQGPLLPRDRPAPLPRRHADRRLGGRGRRTSTSTCATSIPHVREILLREIAPARGGGAARPARRSTCGAAPGPTSAARSRRCSRASRASAGCRATSRRSRRRSACSAGRR